MERDESKHGVIIGDLICHPDGSPMWDGWATLGQAVDACPYTKPHIQRGSSIIARDPEPPYQAHSPTSIAAASAAKPTVTERTRVYAYLAGRGAKGATDDEIQVGLAMNPSTQRPRRIELWKAGLVQDSGQRRLTRGGRQATVWVAV